MENIVATFAGGLSPAQRMRTPASLVLDFFPLLMYIITPELKAVRMCWFLPLCFLLAC